MNTTTFRSLAASFALAAALSGAAFGESTSDQVSLEKKIPPANGTNDGRPGGTWVEPDQDNGFSGDYGSGNTVKDKRIQTPNPGSGVGNFLPPAAPANGDHAFGDEQSRKDRAQNPRTGDGSGGSEVAEGACEADLNRDEAIDWYDLMLVLADYGRDARGGGGQSTGAVNTDIDGSGRVDFNDFLAVLANYGACG